MKKYMILILATLMISSAALATDELTQTIRGKVTDAVTGYPIIGATVIVTGSNPRIGSITDANGNFELKKVSIGRQGVEISFLGYETNIVPNLLIVSGKELSLEIQLQEKVTTIGEVVVTAETKKTEAQNELAMVSARTFSVEETERFAGSLGDPARMVANYAGVMTQNDSRNDIIIRGNSPAGVLWRLEGIEIPNPNHFGAQGTTGGPVSMVNNNLLSNSDFLTGAFPAEYSNALSGVFDINLRSGNSSEHEFTGQVGFNGFELGAEGPFMKLRNGQSASFIANYRYSTLELVNKLGFNVGTGAAIPRYKDLTFLADIPGKKAGRLKIFGLWGKSFIDLGRDLTDTTANEYTQRGVATDFGSDLGVIGVTHTYFFNDKTRLKTTLSWQHSGSSAVLDSVKNETFVPYVRQNQSENKLSFSMQFRRKFSAAGNVSAGLIVDNYSINYLDSINSKDYGRFITYTDIDGKMTLIRTYAQLQHRFGSRITSYAGVNLQHFALNGETAVEPRMGLNLTATEKSSFNMGFGLHSQIQAKGAYFFQEFDSLNNTYSRTNEDMKFTKSAHFVLGYQYLEGNNFRIKVEAYYQHIYNAPVKKSFPEFSMINYGDQFGAPIEDSLINKGKGRNYGLELTVEKFLSHGWYFLLTSSVFNSEYTGYDKIWRNTAFNGSYVFNLLGGHEFKLGQHTLLTTDLKTVWAGGKRYVPVDLAESIRKKEDVRDWSRAYSNKYGDYFRTDLRIGLKMNMKRFSQEWGIDLQNITGYKSIFLEGFDGKKGETYKVYQQGFVPMFLYRIQF